MTDSAPIEPLLKQPEMHRKRKRPGFWRRFLFGAALIFVIVLAAFFGYTGASPTNAWKCFVFGMDIFNAKVQSVMTGKSVAPFQGKQHVNIMLLGVDVSTDPSGNDCRSDTIKFISADFAKSTIAVMSIPRDTWVEIPHHGHQRINSAYSLGGRSEASRVTSSKSVITTLLSDLYGQPIHIDRFIRIQTGGFDRIIDAMGGIDIEVEKQMDYEDPSQLLYIHLKPGLQHLNGRDAEGYVRFRHDKMGDFDRMKRQNKFICALLAKLHEPEMRARLPRLIDPIMSLMYTDIHGTDMLALKDLADKVGMSGIQTCELPTVACMKGAASVVEVRDTEQAAQVIGEMLNGPRPTVTVLNGSGQPGIGRTVSEKIDASQFNVLATGTTSQPIANTTVITEDRCKAAADALANCLGVQQVTTAVPIPVATFGKHVPPPPPANITVVIGSNYVVPAQTAQVGNGAL